MKYSEQKAYNRQKTKEKSTKTGNSLVFVAVSRFQRDVNYNIPVSKGKQPSATARQLCPHSLLLSILYK